MNQQVQISNITPKDVGDGTILVHRPPEPPIPLARGETTSVWVWPGVEVNISEDQQES